MRRGGSDSKTQQYQPNSSTNLYGNEENMTESKSTETQAKSTKVNGQPKRPQHVISNPKDVAQLVMMQIDNVNSKKDELTIAVKGLADTPSNLFECMRSNKIRLPSWPSGWRSWKKAGNDVSKAKAETRRRGK